MSKTHEKKFLNKIEALYTQYEEKVNDLKYDINITYEDEQITHEEYRKVVDWFKSYFTW